MEDIIIVGYGGHGKSVASVIESMSQYHIAGYTDIRRDPAAKYDYLGDDSVLEQLYADGIRNIAIGVGYMGKGTIRQQIISNAKRIGFLLPAIIDSSAILASDVRIGEASFIGKRVVVNAGACVGKACIINTGAIIEHDDRIDDYTHVAVGSVLCGNVQVGRSAFIGANATVIQGVHIGDEAVIAAGSTVIMDVESNTRYYGIVRRE